jgi:hypothetical protein
MTRAPRIDISMHTAISGEMSVLGVQFNVGRVNYRGTRESTIVMPEPLFGCCLDGAHTELVEVTIDGSARTKVRNSGSEQAISLPADRQMTVKPKGEADAGYFIWGTRSWKTATVSLPMPG